MRNPRDGKSKTKLRNNMIAILVILMALFFMRNRITTISEFIDNFVQEINFKYVKVKEGIYTKRLNYETKKRDIKYLDEYIERNKQKDAELQRLKVQNLELKNLREENAELRKMLGLTTKNASEYIAADVIFVEKFSDIDRIFIDKGLEQGVEVNLPVLYDGYLIGKVYKVGQDYSEVILLTNKNSKISVILNDNDTQILRGNGNGTFSIFNYNEPVQEGQLFRITTSGLSDLFVGGLNIGTFQINNVANFNQVKEMRFTPSYKLFEIKNVLVYKGNNKWKY